MAENIFTITKNGKPSLPDSADFESAISATGFGKFNLLLILITIPAGWASTFESSTMSYVFPVAQCDLGLSLEDKGMLNAITYVGMISSAMVWGFLFDTLGRRKLIWIGFLLDALCIVISSFSQTTAWLIASKFFGGFIINGPYAALSVYMCEFHSAKYRGRMQLVIAMIFCTGGMTLPMIAWAVLPANWQFSIFNQSLEFYSWNIFLLICSLPPLVSAIIFFLMPESPKFLMTVGENEKALAIFQKVYSKNSGKQPETFPVKNLINEIELKVMNPNKHGGQITAQRSQIKAIQEGWQQMKPLFYPPYLGNLILVCLLQALFTMNVNTIRLWLPQIFQALNDYQRYYPESTADLCKGLEMMQPSNTTDQCTFNEQNASVYTSGLIVAASVLITSLLTACLINKLGKKKLLFTLGVTAGICAAIIYFSTNMEFAVAFSSLFLSFATVGANVVIVIIIDLFPTTLRTLSLSIALMCGRIGSMIGNLVFPYLIQAGCAPPFIAVASLIFVCAFLVLLLPNTDSKALE